MFGNIAMLKCVIIYIDRIDCFQVFNFALHFVLVINLQLCFIMTELDMMFNTEGFGELKEIFEMVDVVGYNRVSSA